MDVLGTVLLAGGLLVLFWAVRTKAIKPKCGECLNIKL